MRKTGATEAHEYERQHHEGELYGCRILARLVTAAVLFVIGARARARRTKTLSAARSPSSSHLKVDNNFLNEHLPRAPAVRQLARRIICSWRSPFLSGLFFLELFKTNTFPQLKKSGQVLTDIFSRARKVGQIAKVKSD